LYWRALGDNKIRVEYYGEDSTASLEETDGDGISTMIDSKAPPEISTAPPEETDDVIFTPPNLTAPPEDSTASPQEDTPPLELVLVKGLLLAEKEAKKSPLLADYFSVQELSEKEAISPSMEEYFPRTITAFQQKIEEVLLDDGGISAGGLAGKD